MSTLTPMIEQYRQIREQYPDCLLFFRLGDFYELFGDDAELASRELQIVLTGREIGNKQKTPMCGVPYHAAESYIKRLLDKGYKVAICEQLEDAKPGKGIVKREVVRVVTPGTVLNPEFLDQGKNNFIISLQLKKEQLGCAWSDISTGKCYLAEFTGPGCQGYLIDLLSRLQPVECLVREDQLPSCCPEVRIFWEERNVHLTTLKKSISRDQALQLVPEQFGEQQLVGIDQQQLAEGIVATGYLLSYIEETQKSSNIPLRTISVYTPDRNIYLDAMTRRNLELFTTMREGKRERTLLWALDRTQTAMGARLLRQWLEFPLLEIPEIEDRQEAATDLVDNFFLRSALQDALKQVYDLERIIGRVEWEIANPRDLLALARTVSVIPTLKESLQQATSSYLRELGETLDPATEVRELILKGISDTPPLSVKDNGIIRPGYDPEIDRLRQVLDEGEDWIRDFETRERARTGIRSLKVGYNRVFGYYIEVTKANLEAVPASYQRKQTLVQAERFITPELQEREALFSGASEELQQQENQLFLKLRRHVGDAAELIRYDASLLAQLDCLFSYAETAVRYHYTRPVINHSGLIRIVNGRHPVLEQLLGEGEFIPNDLMIGEENNRFHLLTGPNMAGKSTYMRQMALLVLMAHCGSLIPAESAEIGIVDRIFVRAGAMDDLGKGQSTFMMEMNEVSYIVQHATKESLVLLDEIGRGTSTFDGLGIAWAIVEYLHNHIGCKAIFATHYHQLNQLEQGLLGVANYSVAVAEEEERITFLRKVVPGGTDRSYGIQVARLANLPEVLVCRAREIAVQMEAESAGTDLTAVSDASKDTVNNVARSDSTGDCNDGQVLVMITQPVAEEPAGLKSGTTQPPELPKKAATQLVFFDDQNLVLNELRSLNLLNTTPLQALNLLSDWQQRLPEQQELLKERKSVIRKR